jgi:hypothetical protein
MSKRRFEVGIPIKGKKEDAKPGTKDFGRRAAGKFVKLMAEGGNENTSRNYLHKIIKRTKDRKGNK